ncbi:MAG: YlbF family regulator [Bacilli bacterium]|nr:YlbF family regulator [Bacilli bacterium]
MDEILKKAEELKEALYETKEFQEFLRVKALYDTDEELIEYRLKLKKHNCHDKDYQALLKEYNSHPLVVNYLHAKKEVEGIIGVVKDILEK